jgi:hypothetical protein
MPALFAYLIAVALLVGGGYGALNWLAAPEPVKVVAKAAPKPPPPHYADSSEPVAAEARPSKANSADAVKPAVASKTEIDHSGQVEAASAEKAVSGDQPPSALPSPQPEPPATSQQEATASEPAQQDRSAQAAMPQAANDREARHQVEASRAEASTRHDELKQSAQAASPGNAQTIASIAPAAKTAKRPYVRQASRRSEKRPLEVMTLRTIELPDGRRMTQLIPHRSGDRYRGDGPAMVFEPDE